MAALMIYYGDQTFLLVELKLMRIKANVTLVNSTVTSTWVFA